MTRNIDRLTRVRDAIATETLPEGIDKFRMDIWRDQFHTCGTAACIGGLAQTFMEAEQGPVEPDEEFTLTADWLGLNSEPYLANHLFCPTPSGIYQKYSDRSVFWKTITPAEAVGALNILIEGGKPAELIKYWEGVLNERL